MLRFSAGSEPLTAICSLVFFFFVFFVDLTFGFLPHWNTAKVFTVARTRPGGVVHSSSISHAEPFVIHPIDYSAANEYIAEHYTHVVFDEYDDGIFYFNDNVHPNEPIYNARHGVISHASSSSSLSTSEELHFVPPNLERDGFTLLQAPSMVTNWKDLRQIKSVYRQELQHLLVKDLFANEELAHVVIWNPMFRGEHETVSNVERDMTQPNPPTSPTAGMVHIDQDVGAYDVEQILRLIQNNRLMEEDANVFPEILELVNHGNRFAIINFWRNAGTEPIRRHPLAVFSPQYTMSSKEDLYFPNAKPDPVSSRWYTYPEMSPEELLVFKQYDRDGSKPSDIWHCALTSIADESAPPRESFDIRALVVFASKVEPRNDRFGVNRVRPILDYEQSGEFCDAQAEKRKAKH